MSEKRGGGQKAGVLVENRTFEDGKREKEAKQKDCRHLEDEDEGFQLD